MTSYPFNISDKPFSNFFPAQVMSYVGSENDIDYVRPDATDAKIDLLIEQLVGAMDTLFEIDGQYIRVIFKILTGDHHGLGHLLSHKMAGAHDRCLFSGANLLAAKDISIFEVPIFDIQNPATY